MEENTIPSILEQQEDKARRNIIKKVYNSLQKHRKDNGEEEDGKEKEMKGEEDEKKKQPRKTTVPRPSGILTP